MATVNWLHLSDWHQGAGDFDREVVVHELKKDLARRTDLNPALARIDFVFFTGDLAYSGKKEEYEEARRLLLEPVRTVLDVEKEHLFLIPGNHDIDRRAFRRLGPELQQPFTSPEQAGEWLGNEEMRSDVVKPFSAYQQFVNDYKPAGFGNFGAGYKCTIDGKEIGIVGVNSALMCGRDPQNTGKINDYGFLTVGEAQILHTLSDIATADVRIALIHHPFDWLEPVDRNRMENRLQQACDFILRGHVHEQGIQQIASTQGDCVIVRGGTCYNGRIPDRPQYINAYNFVIYDTETRKGTVYLRRWKLTDDGWTADTDRAKDGKYRFTAGKPPAKPKTPRTRKPANP